MGRRSFLPDDRCLGGAMELNATYINHMRKTHDDSGRQVPNRGTTAPSAQQLSLQRARKRAELDDTLRKHQKNLQHLCRRIQDAYSTTERRKDPYDRATYSPVTQQHHRPSSAVVDLCPWLPSSQTASSSHRRPSTAPGAQGNSREGAEITSSAGWQQLKQPPVLKPPVQVVPLPPSRYYIGTNLLPSVQHRLYKSSIMSEILDRQLYKARDIRTLCEDYIAGSPSEDRAIVRTVAAEVLQDLDIHR